MLQFPKQNILSRSHVLRMTMLSQRAVDYSIKAYALNSSELCRQVMTLKHDLDKLEVCIGDRGRTILATGAPIDSHSPLACSSLRIYSALRVVFTAVSEIAQNISVIATHRRKTEFPQTVETGNFVNVLVRMCSVALFEEEISLAKTVLRIEGGRRRFDLALHRARLDLLRRADTHCRCEMAITNCIGLIAEQAYEIAEGVIVRIENSGRSNSTWMNSVRTSGTAHHRLSAVQPANQKRAHGLTLQ